MAACTAPSERPTVSTDGFCTARAVSRQSGERAPTDGPLCAADATPASVTAVTLRLRDDTARRQRATVEAEALSVADPAPSDAATPESTAAEALSAEAAAERWLRVADPAPSAVATVASAVHHAELRATQRISSLRSSFQRLARSSLRTSSRACRKACRKSERTCVVN